MAITRHRFGEKLRRMIDRVTSFAESNTTTFYPKTTAALSSLRLAFGEEMPRKRERPVARRKRKLVTEPQEAEDRPSRKHYYKCRRLEKANEELRAKVASFTAARSQEGRSMIALEWLVKVFLSRPGPSSRNCEMAFRDVVGMDAPSISRRSMHRIRDAWVELFKPMVYKMAASRLEVAVAAAMRVGIGFAPCYVVQVQDEADIHIRSREDDGLGVIRRSRASKVQQSAVCFHDEHGSLDIPTELEALGDKTAATLATSFEGLVRSVASNVLNLPAAGGGSLHPAAQQPPEVWLFHVLVGDGIATNEAAAKRLWQCLQDHGLGPRIRYLLLLVVCGTHQAGLAAKSSVQGRAAAVAHGELHATVIGVSVRLFKYLINDYFDEFVYSVNEWVLRDLVVLLPQDADAEGHCHIRAGGCVFVNKCRLDVD
jgi:hypothetical protein